MAPFKVHAPYQPMGDQPVAIEKLVAGVENNLRHQTLLGATGTGKTYVMAQIVEQVQRPTHAQQRSNAARRQRPDQHERQRGRTA